MKTCHWKLNADCCLKLPVKCDEPIDDKELCNRAGKINVRKNYYSPVFLCHSPSRATCKQDLYATKDKKLCDDCNECKEPTTTAKPSKTRKPKQKKQDPTGLLDP